MFRNESEFTKQYGAVSGIRQMTASRILSQDIGERKMATYLGDLLYDEVIEAERELNKLSSVIVQLKSLSQGIKNSQKVSMADPRINEILSKSRAFDGWTVSLLETDFSVIGMLWGWGEYSSKAATLNSALQTTWATRVLSEYHRQETRTRGTI